MWQGGAKVSEASVIYQELGERHNWTAQLYNGAAACAMQLGNWEEAEQYLQVVLNTVWLCSSPGTITGRPLTARLLGQCAAYQLAFTPASSHRSPETETPSCRGLIAH